jgi:hypothetical protein
LLTGNSHFSVFAEASRFNGDTSPSRRSKRALRRMHALEIGHRYRQCDEGCWLCTRDERRQNIQSWPEHPAGETWNGREAFPARSGVRLPKPPYFLGQNAQFPIKRLRDNTTESHRPVHE